MKKALVALIVFCVGWVCAACKGTTAPGPLKVAPASNTQAMVRPIKTGRCLELYALESRLTKQEFDDILALCESQKPGDVATADAPKQPDEGTQPDAQKKADERRRMIANALERLGFEPTWQMSLLLGALRQVLPEDSDKAVLDLGKRLPTATCAAAEKAFRKDAETRRAGGAALSPLRSDTLKEECFRGVDRADKIFVVVPGHAGDHVTLAFQPPGKTWETRRLVAHVDVDGFRYWFTQVPINSRVVIRHDVGSPANQDEDATIAAAQVDDESLSTDYILPASKDENARYCVQFEGLGEAAMVLLDGSVIPVGKRVRREAGASADTKPIEYFAARSFVTKTEHQFIILDDTGRVRAEVQVRPEDLKENGCYIRRFDMTTRTASTLLISADHSCGALGVVQPRVYAFAKQYLEGALKENPNGTETISDMEPWAAAFSAIARLNGALSPLGTREVGGERGNLDTRYIIQGLAGELLRKGFNRAYVGNLSCGMVANEPSFTFVVHRLDLETALSTKWDDAVASDGRDEGISTEQETVTQLNDLRDAVRTPLARLLQRPYARLVTRSEPSRVLHKPSQVVALWQPPGKPVTAQLRVVRSKQASHDQTRCAEIARERRLISSGALPDGLWDDTKRVDVVQEDNLHLPTPQRDRAGPEERRVELKVDTAGLYVVEFRIPHGKKAWRSVTRDCILVEGDETRPRYAVQLAVSPSVSGTSNALRGDGVLSQVLVSASTGAWSFGPRVTWALPLVLGYSTLSRDARTPPSWNDLRNGVHFDDSGTLPLSWTRRSVLLGFRSDTEWRVLCSIGDTLDGATEPAACDEDWSRFKFFFRFSLLLDGGMIWASRVSPALRDFYDNQPTHSSLLDVDVSTSLQAGVSFRLGSRMDLGAGAQVGWFGFDDFLGVDSKSIRYDSLVAPGFIVEMGYHP